MRKKAIGAAAIDTARQPGTGWLDLDRIATVEVTSENPDFPVESVFAPVQAQGWRAAEMGTQTIRLVFDEPEVIHRIRLEFSETAVERTQEFTLRWTAGQGGHTREIVRQQGHLKL